VGLATTAERLQELPPIEMACINHGSLLTAISQLAVIDNGLIFFRNSFLNQFRITYRTVATHVLARRVLSYSVL